jgi:hypothetical protein
VCEGGGRGRPPHDHLSEMLGLVIVLTSFILLATLMTNRF